jgi:hypothetical protein
VACNPLPRRSKKRVITAVSTAAQIGSPINITPFDNAEQNAPRENKMARRWKKSLIMPENTFIKYPNPSIMPSMQLILSTGTSTLSRNKAKTLKNIAADAVIKNEAMLITHIDNGTSFTFDRIYKERGTPKQNATKFYAFFQAARNVRRSGSPGAVRPS